MEYGNGWTKKGSPRDIELLKTTVKAFAESLDYADVEMGQAHSWSRQSLYYQNCRPIWKRAQQAESELGWR